MVVPWHCTSRDCVVSQDLGVGQRFFSEFAQRCKGGELAWALPPHSESSFSVILRGGTSPCISPNNTDIFILFPFRNVALSIFLSAPFFLSVKSGLLLFFFLLSLLSLCQGFILLLLCG